MDFTGLEGLGKVAGIAGISIGAIVLIFRSVIQKNIFPTLESSQAYSILKLIIMCSFLFGIAGLITYGIAKPKEKEGTRALTVIGIIMDTEGQPLPNVLVSVIEEANLSSRTDSRGRYKFTLIGRGKTIYDMEYKSSSHLPLRLGNTVDFNTEEDIFSLEEVRMTAKKEITEVERVQEPAPSTISTSTPISNASPLLNENVKEPDDEVFSQEENSVYLQNGGNIFGYDCNIDQVTISLGSYTFDLSGLPKFVTIPPGFYSVSSLGTINCGGMNYHVSYYGDLQVLAGANYYTYWYINDLGGIDFGLATEEELNLLKTMGF